MVPGAISGDFKTVGVARLKCKSQRFTFKTNMFKKKYENISFYIIYSQWSNAKRAQKLNSTNSMKLIRILSTTTQHKILRF